ncbi:MAG: DUF5685 family protein [Clostridiales bacterium]|nr:DUF5685 family protein [Clostridiales bacterium]
MFGYVTASQEQLGEENFEIFCAYYCGLCRAMGKCCSQASRLSLSYDINFLAIMLSSVTDSKLKTREKRCVVHPIKKRKSAVGDTVLDYSACMGVLLSYLKMADDWHDDKSPKALLAMLVLRGGVRRARRQYPREYLYIRQMLCDLSALEKEGCTELDRVCDCFAKILEKLFAPEFITEDNVRRPLAWFGYNLGRWIYVIDAINDLDEDYKSGAYNPFLAGFSGDLEMYKRELLKNQSMTLTMALNNASGAFDLLEPNKNRDLLHKIIYGSLYIKQNTILNKLNASKTQIPKTGEDDGSL